MNGVDHDHVSDIVFQRSISEQYGAELAIGPALALVVGQTPSSGLRQTLLSVAVVVMVFSSVIRFLAFTDRFADPERVSRLTVRPLQISAMVCLVQIVHFAATGLSEFVPNMGTLGASLLITVFGTVLFVFSFESIFQTYRFSWGILYYVKILSITNSVGLNMGDSEAVLDKIVSGKSSLEMLKAALSLLLVQVIRIVYASVAYYLLRDSIPEDKDDPYIEEVRTWVDTFGKKKPVSDRSTVGFAFVISGIVVIPVYLVLSWTLSWFLGPILAVAGVVVVMRLLQHVINVTYIAFGGLRYDQILTTNRRSIAIDGLYTLVIWVMLVWLPFG